MADLTPERLAELRALAAGATPGPWEIDSRTHYDVAPSATDWQIPDLERWRGYANPVGFGEDEATARYVAAVSPDVVTALLDEIEMARADYDGAMADLAALVDVAAGAVSDETADDPGVMRLMRYLAANHAEKPAPTAFVQHGDMAVELPGIEPDKVVDLMEALERSVNEAKTARRRGPQQGSE